MKIIADIYEEKEKVHPFLEVILRIARNKIEVEKPMEKPIKKPTEN